MEFIGEDQGPDADPRSSASGPPLGPLDSIVSRLEEVEQRSRELEAERMHLLAEVHELARQNGIRRSAPRFSQKQQELSYREVRADIATALHVSERTIDRHISDAFLLVRDYEQVVDALREGHISPEHARVILDAGAVIGADTDEETERRRQRFIERILPIARQKNATRLRPIARRLAEQFSQTSLEERHAEARLQRKVWLQERDDGMADLTAHLPAPDAYAIYDLLTRAAKSLNVEGEERRADEIRADVLRDRLLDALPKAIPSPSETGDIEARIQIVVPVASLFPEAATETTLEPVQGGTAARDPGLADKPPPQTNPPPPSHPPSANDGPPPSNSPPHSDSPPTINPPPPLLEGYGPIDLSSTRELAARGSHWERIRVDEIDGTILSVDRYRPSEEIRRYITARDQRCRFPGCRVPAHRCDIDHTVDAAYGGPTSTDNLGLVCVGHHTLKHHSRWRVKQRKNGTFEWTSPSGRTHLDRPGSRVSFTDISDPRTLNDDVTKASERNRKPRDEYDDNNHPF